MRSLVACVAFGVIASPLHGVAATTTQFLEEIKNDTTRLEAVANMTPEPQPTPPTVGTNNATLAKEIEKLNKRVGTVEAGASADSERVAKSAEIRYEFGKKAIAQMKSATKIIKFSETALSAEQDFAKISNLWDDTDLRNGWDTLRTYGSIGGFTIAAVGISMPDGTENKNAIGAAGTGVAAATLLLGSLLGDENGKTVKDKVAFVEFTRNAYDDLLVRRALLQGYIEQNKKLLADLETFKGTYEKASNLDEKQTKLVELESVYLRFRETLDQLPGYTGSFRRSVQHFKKTAEKVGKEKPKGKMAELDLNLSSLDTKLAKIEAEYNEEIRPIFEEETNILVLIRGVPPQ